MRAKGILMLKRPLAVLMLLAFAICAVAAQEAKPVYTRAEFVAMIADYFAWPHPADYNDIWKVPLRKLADVKADSPYAKRIDTAIEAGAIDVDSTGKFYPDKAISRQDAALVFARAFLLAAPGKDPAAQFADAKTIKPIAREAVNALLASGLLLAKTATEYKPNDPLTADEAKGILAKITAATVSPVQAMPKTNAVAPRRYIKLYCPTPGAEIHYTTDGSAPTASSPVYTVPTKGFVNEMLSPAQAPSRDVVYRAIAIKEGLAVSPEQTFVWHLFRPEVDEFQSLLIQPKTATSPAVYRISNDSESVRPMAWYIEGQERGIVFDALQTAPNVRNLKEYVDRTLATKPNFLVIGHEHGDHNAQAMNFLKAGVDVYANKRGWAAMGSASGPFPAVFPDPADQARIKNIEEGDTLSLGGCTLSVYALPGHAVGNIILQDKANGLIFASDIYGCTRAGSADNVAVQQVKADLLLAMAQQVHSKYRENGGKIVSLFTGHDETPLNENNLFLFEKALQKAVDFGEAGCSPTLRGNNDAPNSRTVLIGDMWKDGTNWMALKLLGIMGDKTEFLTSTPINYNGPEGFTKYAVLSNVEFTGGTLVGTTLAWNAPPAPFKWAGTTVTAPNALPDRFDPWTYAYVVRVPVDTKAISIRPTAMSTRITSMTINGNAIASGTPRVFPVMDGTVLTLRIVALDGVTEGNYTFTVQTY